MIINGISSIPSIPAVDALRSTTPAAPGSFAKVMNDALGSVQSLQDQAHASALSYLNGESTELHQVALDQQRASIAFEMMMQVRNKVLSAYQEVMRTQL